jgi:hypothetical protein
MESNESVTTLINKLHSEALEQGRDTYRDPVTGYAVFTADYHRRRGTCCGSGCRHCPFNHVNVGKGPRRLMSTLIGMLLCLTAQAQVPNVWFADTVLSFSPGTGQNVGQGPVFFPANVLRGPDPQARPTSGSMDPREICSLGRGGEIIVGFINRVIIDEPGDDFVVLENAFRYGRGRLFAEPGEVSVSTDGVTWATFACDSLETLAGCAGTAPVDATQRIGEPTGGGDRFDLATIGADSVRWVRIRDRTGAIIDNPQHPSYDPTLTGFDLDAIVAIHAVPRAFSASVQFAATSELLTVYAPSTAMVDMYTPAGRLVETQHLEPGISEISLQKLPPGLYLVRYTDPSTRLVYKVLR